MLFGELTREKCRASVMSATTGRRNHASIHSMKWFTRDEYETEDARVRYERHLAVLAPSLPAGVLELTTLVIGDAKVRSWAAEDGVLTLCLSVLDASETVEEVNITYHEASVEVPGDGDLGVLALTAGDVALLDSEVDQEDDGLFLHRHWAWPTGQFTVRFKDATVVRSPLSSLERHQFFGHPPYRS